MDVFWSSIVGGILMFCYFLFGFYLADFKGFKNGSVLATLFFLVLLALFILYFM